MFAPSHEQIAKELGVWQGPGQLSPGVQAFTVWNENRQILIRGSGNFNPIISSANQALLQKIFSPK
jgi:hypothetical protein